MQINRSDGGIIELHALSGRIIRIVGIHQRFFMREATVYFIRLSRPKKICAHLCRSVAN